MSTLLSPDPGAGRPANALRMSNCSKLTVEIRDELVARASPRGRLNFASNLGVVELCLALPPQRSNFLERPP